MCRGTSEISRQDGFPLEFVRISFGLPLPDSGSIWCGQSEGNVRNVCGLLDLRSMRDSDGRMCLCSGQWLFQLAKAGKHMDLIPYCSSMY